MNHDISNRDDVIDSRDVIERIEELQDERTALVNKLDEASSTDTAAVEDVAAAKTALHEWQEDNGDELSALEALASEAEGYSVDWRHGETLINDSYWSEYVRELL